MRVKVPAVGLLSEEREVTLCPEPDSSDRWVVYNESGNVIGEVWKGTHTYSPPTHKGSRIARYHRRVSHWRNNRTQVHWETRKRALADLLANEGKT
jgi:hypothetical protein